MLASDSFPGRRHQVRPLRVGRHAAAVGQQLPQRHCPHGVRIAQPQIRDVARDRRVQCDLPAIRQLCDPERGERFRNGPDVEQGRRRNRSMSRQVAKAIALLQHDPAVQDQRQCRARDMIAGHEADHYGIGRGKIRRRCSA